MKVMIEFKELKENCKCYLESEHCAKTDDKCNVEKCPLLKTWGDKEE